jgi:serine/threonine-protein kinase
LVHRDLKPDNIFLNRAGGEADFVKVLDFGVAKLKDPKFGSEKLTQAGMIFGTPRYMSPEQARAKELDERSDIYALGVIMFECLTGKAPFEAADPIGVLVKHCNEPVPTFASVNPSLAIDPGFEEIVRRCLAKKPEQRPATVKALRAELDALDVRLASGRPAPDDNATRHIDLGASPEDTQRDQSAPDTFDRLGITARSGGQPANASIVMHSESHRAAHDKAPLATIVIGALGVLAAGAAALIFFSKEEAPVVVPAPAPAASVAAPAVPPVAPPTPAAAVVPAGSGSGSGSGSGGTPEAALSGAPPAAPAAPAAPTAKPEESKAPTNATTPAPKRVVDSKPAKKTTTSKPGEPVDPYAE